MEEGYIRIRATLRPDRANEHQLYWTCCRLLRRHGEARAHRHISFLQFRDPHKVEPLQSGAAPAPGTDTPFSMLNLHELPILRQRHVECSQSSPGGIQ
jgi:hypothetical protein